MRYLTYMALALTSTSCTTPIKSSLVGTVVGTAVTTGLSFAVKDIDPTQRMGLITAGATVGGAAGYLDHQQKQRNQTKATSRWEAAEFPTPMPPVVRRMIVPDRIEGNKLIKAHEIFIIEQSSAWGTNND